MKPIFFAIAAGIAALPPLAAAADAVEKELRLIPKEAFLKHVSPSARAPFSVKAEHAPGMGVNLAPQPEARRGSSSSGSSCATQQALCYDSTNGRIVYKPARSLMPDIPGLQRENISVKRHSITFRYTF